MMLTQKESGLLKDMKGQEELCIAKYQRYAEMAKANELKTLFSSMAGVEESHLQTVTAMMNGTVAKAPAQIGNSNDRVSPAAYGSEEDRKADALLCRDMLSTEKHVSSLYDTSIFEFQDPAARRLLNHIQAEEQQHGEQLYAYMKANGMYS
ncbi:MAG: spore coat protein [Ruminococcaceae bacterium]|nr:spore coat protein [Oscillospiraceae bacterium]